MNLLELHLYLKVYNTWGTVHIKDIGNTISKRFITNTYVAFWSNLERVPNCFFFVSFLRELFLILCLSFMNCWFQSYFFSGESRRVFTFEAAVVSLSQP